MSRVYNFSAGPAVLPEEVLKEVADEMMDYNGTGMSVMEMSHRSAAFQEIIDTAEKDLRELMNIPDKIGKLQGTFPSGRSIPAVCHDPDEPYEKQGRRLYRNRTVGKKSLSGSSEIRKSKQDRIF